MPTLSFTVGLPLIAGIGLLFVSRFRRRHISDSFKNRVRQNPMVRLREKVWF